MSSAPVHGQLALDPATLAGVKRQARDDPRAALHTAAQQFEAVFLNMVLKSMRDATPQSELFGGEQTRMYQQMLDQQLAQTLSTRNATGLAALMEKQLARGLPGAAQDAPSGATPLSGAATAASPPPHAALPREWQWTPPAQRAAAGATPSVGAMTPASQAADAKPDAHRLSARARRFIDEVWPHALEAARTTGIPAHFMVAQAALETGWGKSMPRAADGRPSFNLFGLKAGRGGDGDAAHATTTEYVGGAARRSVERFRSYGSYAEAFRDYARMLTTSPRYAGVVGRQDAAGFAQGLQKAGYATDPMYAAKLERIIGGATLRQALAGTPKVYS